MRRPDVVLRKMFCKYHISLIQETNFPTTHAFERFCFLAKKEYKSAIFVNDSGTILDRSASASQPRKHGGVCTILHSDLRGFSTAEHRREYDITNRYMVIRLHWGDQEVFIHNVYAPADPRQLQRFFKSLPTEFPEEAMHIIGGDLNAVIDPALDSETCQTSNIAGTQALSTWLSALNVVDPWRIHHEDTRLYSSPKRKNRLDYIMISPILSDLYYRESSYVDEVFGSDHLAIRVQLTSSHAVHRKGPWRLRPSTLNDPSIHGWITSEMQKLLETLDSTRNPGLVYQSWKRIMRTQLIKLQREPLEGTKSELDDAREDLIRKSTIADHISTMELEAAQDRVQQAEEAHNGYLRQAAFHHQFVETEASTSFFFRPTTTTLSRCPIDRVRLENGEVSTDQLTVQGEHQRFWGSIYGDYAFATPEDQQIDPEAQEKLLDTISQMLSDDQRATLDHPTTVEEIAREISQLAKRKAPGYDGLGAEFYQVDVKTMAAVLKIVFDYQLNRTTRPTLLPDQRRSVVVLLHKGKGRDNPANYRPISLIPVDVKILSRVLTTRLRGVIASLVHTDQRGFVPGRSISHSLLQMYDLQDYVTHHEDTAFATFVDAEKAFDRVNWDYMWRVLRRMGFGDVFISWCQLLYRDTTIQLNINGWIQEKISPTRGVKQGDPLSAMLFILTMEPLANLIRLHPEFGYKAPGLDLVVTGSYFADDTTLISNSIESAKAQLELVQTYCAGSGAKLNISKTNLICLNRNADPIPSSEVRVLKPNESCRYLGLPIGQQVNNATRVSVISTRFSEQLTRWKHRARTFRGRKLLARAVILSQLWYASAVTYVPKSTIKAWQRTIDLFIVRSIIDDPKARRPISMEWLYRTNALGLPHVRSILKRQRIVLLCQLVQDSESALTTTWSSVAQHQLTNLPPGLSRPGRHDYLWWNPKLKRSQQALNSLPQWLRCILLTWLSAHRPLNFDNLTLFEAYEIHIHAPIWMNRYTQWQYRTNEQDQQFKSLLPPPGDPSCQFRLQVAKHCGIFSLKDVFSNGRWPTLNILYQRIALNFATAGDPPPSKRSVSTLHRQLTQILRRVQEPDGYTLDTSNALTWPWKASLISKKRFPLLPSRQVAQMFTPTKIPKTTHPFLRHGVLDDAKLQDTLEKLRNQHRHISPIYHDVRYRVRWFLLPTSGRYSTASPTDSQFCKHNCRQVETYQHIFSECRVSKPLWRTIFENWSPVFLGQPVWQHMLFGINLKVRTPYRPHTAGIQVLWNVVCATTFHTLWRTRNDKKHRSIDPPPTKVLVDTITKTTMAHVLSIRRIFNENVDLLADLDILCTQLNLPLQ